MYPAAATTVPAQRRGVWLFYVLRAPGRRKRCAVAAPDAEVARRLEPRQPASRCYIGPRLARRVDDGPGDALLRSDRSPLHVHAAVFCVARRIAPRGPGATRSPQD